MAEKKFNLKFELSDGTIQEVPFTLPQGEKGDKGDKGDSSIAETITEATMVILQNSTMSTIDYVPVYKSSSIVLEVVECHFLEGPNYVPIPVAFSVLPKYANYAEVEGVKSITAMRIGSSTAKVNITLRIHEIQSYEEVASYLTDLDTLIGGDA